jgi:hypothetical protein
MQLSDPTTMQPTDTQCTVDTVPCSSDNPSQSSSPPPSTPSPCAPVTPPSDHPEKILASNRINGRQPRSIAWSHFAGARLPTTRLPKRRRASTATKRSRLVAAAPQLCLSTFRRITPTCSTCLLVPSLSPGELPLPRFCLASPRSRASPILDATNGCSCACIFLHQVREAALPRGDVF